MISELTMRKKRISLTRNKRRNTGSFHELYRLLYLNRIWTRQHIRNEIVCIWRTIATICSQRVKCMRVNMKNDENNTASSSSSTIIRTTKVHQHKINLTEKKILKGKRCSSSQKEEKWLHFNLRADDVIVTTKWYNFDWWWLTTKEKKMKRKKWRH